jgi:RNA polymerase sigma-70 factor, ECF subfamily
MAPETNDRSAIEARFAAVFAHLGLITAYSRRRGALDPDGIAAEAMAIAWRRLADVPTDDPRPWLIATARNLVLAERRRHRAPSENLDIADLPTDPDAPSPILDLDPELEAALAALSPSDREALLLVAWEDLTPAAAAASLGMSAGAFRVRLHRARRRLLYELETRGRQDPRAHRQPSLEQL